MKQHGGYILRFKLNKNLVNEQRKKDRSLKTRNKTRSRTIGKSRLPTASRYASVPLYGKGSNLYKLNQLKRWIKI